MRGVDAAAIVEHLDRLREIRDAREQRDPLLGEPLGVAAAAPVLVERADGERRLLGKSELERDRRTAVAADPDQLARGVRGARDGDELSHSFAKRAARRDGTRRLDGESEARMPVHALHSRLDRLVVGREQRRHAARVARAAGVLEEQRVVERRALIGLESDRFGDAHPDQAGAHRVSGRRALGEVERARERGEHFGETDSALYGELLRDAARATVGDDFRDGKQLSSIQHCHSGNDRGRLTFRRFGGCSVLGASTGVRRLFNDGTTRGFSDGDGGKGRISPLAGS